MTKEERTRYEHDRYMRRHLQKKNEIKPVYEVQTSSFIEGFRKLVLAVVVQSYLDNENSDDVWNKLAIRIYRGEL